MKDLLTVHTEEFSNFVTEHYPQFKKMPGGILSYAVELPVNDFVFNPDYALSRFTVAFYYERPDHNFYFFASDPVLEINDSGEGRFAVIDKKLKELKKNFISNLDKSIYKNFPLFTGGMKFNIEHSDSDWKEFSDSSWFIPESMILKSDKLYFIFNTLIPFPKETVLKKFKQKLNFFLAQSSDQLNFAVRAAQVNGASPKEKKKWKTLVSASLDMIHSGEVNKVVLSRLIEIKLHDELSFNFVLNKFRQKFPSCYLFIYKRNRSVFFGATPERLAEFRNTRVDLDALAGSKPRGVTAEEDIKLEKELLSDEKILNEHNFVVKHLNSALSSHLDDIINENPCVLKLDNIQHIITRINGYLKDENCMFNLLKEVFPTPAVCGYPKEKALQLIKKLEEHQRGLYSGIVGWYNLNGTAEFIIAIRSALYSNKRLLAYAGSGIVESSVPDEEFRETELKLQSIISLFDENKN